MQAVPDPPDEQTPPAEKGCTTAPTSGGLYGLLLWAAALARRASSKRASKADR